MPITKKVDKRQVRQHFSCHAREYDRYARVQQKVATRLVASLCDDLLPRQAALEVGCGTGLLSAQLLQRQPELKLILSDIAHGMSQHVQSVLPQAPGCDADAAALPFKDQGFGLVVSSSVYQWLNDLPNAFAEVARVLRPDGVFALALFAEKTLYELRTSHQAALPDTPSHGQNFPSLEAVAAALQGRFEIITLRSEFEVEWHADVPELLRSLKKIGAQNASQQRPSGFASRQVMQAMMTHYGEVYGSERGIPATYEVVYLLARRL